jgi:glycosyltransferase involved in cell wall biosynthesis
MKILSCSPLLSICIPAYSRPRQLELLLRSIDCNPQKIEIVICEDFSDKRVAIREIVIEFQARSPYQVRYFENLQNLGYDGNIRELVKQARGKFIIFMGDDDLFIPRALAKFLTFLTSHINVKYVLRSYVVVHADGAVELFRYMSKTTELQSGEKTVAWLFKRSVTICGFTINREEALKHATADLDGTLLYQIYLMAQVCLEYSSIYCDIPVAQANQSYRDDKSMFGNSISEKSRFTPGSISEDNSINFTKAFFDVTGYIDRIHDTQLTALVKQSLSKYSYPFLSIQRKRGIAYFLRYANRLERECGIGVTLYFHIYKWLLVLFGENNCDRMIRLIKRVLPYTPNL